MAGGAASEYSRGGMRTKIDAGKIATAAGCAMIIASGKVEHPLRAIMDGARHSWFAPSPEPVKGWKTWIAGKLVPAGRLVIDDGAERALMTGKSLLPAGVRTIEGDFSRGDTVAVMALDGREIARGLSINDRLGGFSRGIVIADATVVFRRPHFDQRRVFLDFGEAEVGTASALFAELVDSALPGIAPSVTGL